MSVVVSLLRAIDRADGDALVMHVGEKPYVVTGSGHAELAANALTISAMTGMLDQLLPVESRKALNELGAVEYHLPSDPASPGVRYSVVAARGGNDIWIEIRRRKVAEEPVRAVAQPSAAVAVEEPSESALAVAPRTPEHHHERARTSDLAAREPVDRHAPFEHVEAPAAEPPAPLEPPEPPPAMEETMEYEPRPGKSVEAIAEPSEAFALKPPSEDDTYVAPGLDDDLDSGSFHLDDLPPPFDFGRDADFSDVEVRRTNVEPERPGVPSASTPRANVQFEAPPLVERRRAPVGTDLAVGASGPSAGARPIAVTRKHADPLHHLLHVAAASGASGLYVAPQAKPSLRVDGEIRVLDEAPLSEEQLQAGLRALLQLAPDAPVPVGEIAARELPDVGRLQYVGFRDHRGIGATFRMLPGRAISSEQAGLSAPIQALCTEPEGLLLVTGARAAGKSTLVAALVDHINRSRRDHVITVESEIHFVHENRNSFVSQREAREDQQFAEMVRAAMREEPDVLVIDGGMSAEVAALALQAAAEGHLVIASTTAPSTATALERFVNLLGGNAETRTALGDHLRGVVMQALLRKTGGGRAAAREVLVNVPAVASLLASGQFDQIPAVLNGGRRIGMIPLNDALVGLVQSGTLDVRQAYRKSPDPRELVEMLNRAGFDTAFAERLS